MTLPTHLSAFEGSLYDTRDSGFQPLRENYSKHHRTIASVADLKATLRAGEYAWPGGYQLFFLTNDGETISFDGVRGDFYNTVYEITEGYSSRIVACDVTYEDTNMICAETNKPIPAAYCE